MASAKPHGSTGTRLNSSANVASSTDPRPPVLLIGVTGGTGRTALQGLLAGGLMPSELVAVTRNLNSDAAVGMVGQGLSVLQADLEDEDSICRALQGTKRIYCHALSGDAATADPAEVRRARLLARAAASAGVQHVVYNSSAGRGANAGISQMDQKHKVEDIFREEGVPLTALQATMFMEEFWKKYTRPQILKGTFPFSLPGDRPLQLVASRDIGLAAAIALQDPDKFAGRAIAMAGDELTPQQMCTAFSQAQGGAPVRHSSPPAWLFWFLSRDLYRIITFLRTTGYQADVAACRKEFPGMLSFPQFLRATRWSDAARTYEQGIRFEDV